METLTELGRHQICKAIGIRNANSIFVKSKEAFIDRMNLYRLVYNIDKLVDTYKEELARYKTEDEFIYKINKDKALIYSTIESEIVKVEMVDNLFSSCAISKILRATTEYNVLLIDETNECTLRFYFESPVYEAFKFLVYGFCDCSSTFSDFVYKLTNNKFLATTSDLDLCEFSDNSYRSVLKAQMNLISSVITDIISPKYINRKHVKYLKGAEVLVSSTINKTVDSLDKVVTELRNAKGCSFENICAELFTTTMLAKNRDIALKNLILPNKETCKLNVINYDEYTFIKYLRKIREEQETDYDSFLSKGDMELRVTQGIDIAWI